MIRNSNQNIDRVIQSITLVTENRCSLSDEDVRLLKQVVVELKRLRYKQEQRNKYEVILEVVKLLTKIFALNEVLSQFADLIN